MNMTVLFEACDVWHGDVRPINCRDLSEHLTDTALCLILEVRDREEYYDLNSQYVWFMVRLEHRAITSRSWSRLDLTWNCLQTPLTRGGCVLVPWVDILHTKESLSVSNSSLSLPLNGGKHQSMEFLYFRANNEEYPPMAVAGLYHHVIIFY